MCLLDLCRIDNHIETKISLFKKSNIEACRQPSSFHTSRHLLGETNELDLS
jgi:hypothetical protein